MWTLGSHVDWCVPTPLPLDPADGTSNTVLKASFSSVLADSLIWFSLSTKFYNHMLHGALSAHSPSKRRFFKMNQAMSNLVASVTCGSHWWKWQASGFAGARLKTSLNEWKVQAVENCKGKDDWMMNTTMDTSEFDKVRNVPISQGIQCNKHNLDMCCSQCGSEPWKKYW